MKYAVSIITLITILGFTLMPNCNNNATAAKPKINWMPLDKAQAYMKSNPKKAYFDIYTSTCIWCKVMDKKTFANRNVIKYLNENYYCVKFNAESKAVLEFNGKKYGYNKKYKVHELAIELMRDELSFPMSVFFDEEFRNSQPVPGFLTVSELEMTAKYIAENKHRTMPWSKYLEEFKSTWTK